MPIYEIAISRRMMCDNTVNVVVRAKDEKTARRKALREVKQNEDTWFGPISSHADISIDESNKLHFVPDCTILE